MNTMLRNDVLYTTPIGSMVKQATSRKLPSENWPLISLICEAINEDKYPNCTKSAVKAIAARLTNNKNYLQVSITLSLLDACVKNCGLKFQSLVLTKKFCLNVLMKVIAPKNILDSGLQQRILGLIANWTDQFRSNPQLSGVQEAYFELKKQGYGLPALNSVSPILLAPAATNLVSQKQVRNLRKPTLLELQKFRSELKDVNANVQMLNEMMDTHNPLICHSSDHDLIKEIYGICMAMQNRILKLCTEIQDQSFLSELNDTNDRLNEVTLRYNRFAVQFSQRDSVEDRSNPSDGVMPVGNNVLSGSSNSLQTGQPAPTWGANTLAYFAQFTNQANNEWTAQLPKSFKSTNPSVPCTSNTADTYASQTTELSSNTQLTCNSAPIDKRPENEYSFPPQEINLSNIPGLSAPEASYPLVNDLAMPQFK